MRSWGARGGGTGAACTASRPLSHPARAGLEEGRKRGPAGPTAKGCWGCKKPLMSAWTHANKTNKKKVYQDLQAFGTGNPQTWEKGWELSATVMRVYLLLHLRQKITLNRSLAWPNTAAFVLEKAEEQTPQSPVPIGILVPRAADLPRETRRQICLAPHLHV